MPTTLWQITVPAAVAVAVLLFLMLRARFAVLRLVASPVEHAAQRRADDAERELASANARIDALEKENADLLKERSLQAVIDQVAKVSAGVDQTLTKLGDLNGSLATTKEGLDEAVKGLQAATTAVEFLASRIVIDIKGDTP